MASPVGDSYACPPGSYIAAGRRRFPANARISIWGQSNAVGRAEQADISASPLSSDSGLAAFASSGFSRVYIWTGTAYSLLTMSNNQSSAGQFGAEFGLAVRWMRETTSGNLYIDKNAGSGVSITSFAPEVYGYYTLGKNGRTAQNTWLANNGFSGVVDAGFVWIQGESDAAQTQSWYQARLETILSAAQTDAIIGANTKRLLMQMATGTASYSAAIAAAKSAIASANPTNTLAPSMPGAGYMKSDNLHQNGRGQVQAGYNAFELIFNKAHIAI